MPLLNELKSRVFCAAIVAVGFFAAMMSSRLVHATTHYETLGVPHGASQQDIKDAYRRLARLHHPNMHMDAPATVREMHSRQFVIVNEAYQALRDVDKRRAYDGSPMDIFDRTEALAKLSVDDVGRRLELVSGNLSDLIQLGNLDLERKYSSFMSELSKDPRFATLEILKTLMKMESIQQVTYGSSVGLNFWESRFDTAAIYFTTGRLLLHMSQNPSIDGLSTLNELTEFANTVQEFNLSGVPFRYKLRHKPRFSLNLASELYRFAVRKNLIRDSESLVAFSQNYVEKLLDNSDRSSPSGVFLSTELGYTLSVLNDATDAEIIFILKELKKMDQAIAYEELVRTGRLFKMDAGMILRVLKEVQTFVKYYRENPQFGESDRKMGESIAFRIKSASLAAAQGFKRTKPNISQVKTFAKFSDFTFGQFTYASHFPKPLPTRSYEVVTGFPHSALVPVSTGQSFISSIPTTAIGYDCRLLFK